MLFHCLEEGTLRLRSGTIDFVSENQFRKYRARLKLEVAALLAKYRHADNVRRQQVARELDTIEA